MDDYWTALQKDEKYDRKERQKWLQRDAKQPPREAKRPEIDAKWPQW